MGYFKTYVGSIIFAIVLVLLLGSDQVNYLKL
jgi:hypothetical protein